MRGSKLRLLGGLKTVINGPKTQIIGSLLSINGAKWSPGSFLGYHPRSYYLKKLGGCNPP